MNRILPALAVLAGGALLVLAPSAGAASPRGGWSSPAITGNEGGIPVATLQRPGPIAGWAEFERGIAGVGFTLVEDPSLAGQPCSARGRVLPQSAPGGANRVEFAFDAPFPCNRRYQVRATVAPEQGPLRDDTNLVLNLLVDVALPPSPATGVTADVGADRTVTVRWGSEPQAPDFEGYQVERAVGDGPFRKVGEVGATQTSFVDGGVPDEGGTLRYRVIAMRSGPRAGTTVFAEPSSPAVAEVPATVPATPDEATAGDVGADGAGGGDDGTGGAGGTSGTAPTARRARRGAVARRTTATTIDTGYQVALPFDRSAPPSESPVASPSVPPPGDPAVVARLDDDSDDDGRRQSMLLLAGGTVAFSWAMLLRLVTRRALLV